MWIYTNIDKDESWYSKNAYTQMYAHIHFWLKIGSHMPWFSNKQCLVENTSHLPPKGNLKKWGLCLDDKVNINNPSQ